MSVEPNPPAPGSNGAVVAATSSEVPTSPAGLVNSRGKRSRWRNVFIAIIGLLVIWGVLSYLIIPRFLTRYARKHPSLTDLPGITEAKDGMPGDPLNVALIGTEDELLKAMVAADWHPADPLTLKSCLRIAEDTVLKRPDPEAPVSNLLLFGRKQDLAFEQPVGGNPRQRHHVRFWKTPDVDSDGRPIWIGAAIYDERVGMSRETTQITHVTAPDIDSERDKLFNDLRAAGDLIDFFVVEDFHKVRSGRNGGGDPWHTDGNLYAGVLK
jgi:hypothetical protein